MERKYGVATHVYVPVVKRASADYALAADWTPAAGDVKISKDGGAAANVANLPAAITMGNTAMWDFALTATEMQAAQVLVSVADSATKAVEDTFVIVETYGHASALHEFDRDTPAVTLADDAITAAKIAAGAITNAKFAAGAIDAAAIAADAIGASELAADAVTEIQAGLATAAALATVDDYIDTEIGDIVARVTDLQARLPAALVSGRIDANVGAMAANTMTAAAANPDLTTELQAGLATAANVAAVEAKVDTVDDFLDTEIAAVKAKTDLLPAAPASTGDVAAVAAFVDTEVAATLAAVDTEVAAIKAKTDTLPAAPASTGDVTAVETKVDAVKAKTDLLPASPAATGDIPTAAAIADAVLDEPLPELANVPAAAPTLRQAVQFVFMALRNKVTTTTTETSLHDDAGSVIATATVSDNGATFTRDEYT